MIQVDYLVPADAAAASEGKLYIHGAGWDSILAASFPVTHPQLSVALRLRVPWVDTNQPQSLELDVLDADGQSVLPNPPGAVRGTITVGRPARVQPGADQVSQLVLNLRNLTFASAGTYVIVFRINGTDAAQSPFNVVALGK